MFFSKIWAINVASSVSVSIDGWTNFSIKKDTNFSTPTMAKNKYHNHQEYQIVLKLLQVTVNQFEVRKFHLWEISI
uniref:Putative ovule protein n=1 Tax=Solanum chacoense TaxID=4108 RepID=A0A0V0GJR2_SOLCH